MSLEDGLYSIHKSIRDWLRILVCRVHLALALISLLLPVALWMQHVLESSFGICPWYHFIKQHKIPEKKINMKLFTYKLNFYRTIRNCWVSILFAQFWHENCIFHLSPTILTLSKYDERGKFGLDYWDLVNCRKALST